VLAIAARAVAQRFNADPSDHRSPTLACGCGRRARYAGRRPKTFQSALGELTLEEVLDLIGQLYAVERACPTLGPAASEEARADARQLRAAARREQSIAIVDAIRAWAFRQRALPESSLGKAIAYMLGLWNGLTRFLGDARIPLDNNATERGLRGMVVAARTTTAPGPSAAPRSPRSSTPSSRPPSSPA